MQSDGFCRQLDGQILVVDVVFVSLPPLPDAVARNIALYSVPLTASNES